MSKPLSAATQSDELLAKNVAAALSALQKAIHDAVEEGLKVEVTIERMHQVGQHYPEPLVEVTVERVIRLS